MCGSQVQGPGEWAQDLQKPCHNKQAPGWAGSESPDAWSPGAIAREEEQGTWHTLLCAHPCCPSECLCTFPRPTLVMPYDGISCS